MKIIGSIPVEGTKGRMREYKTSEKQRQYQRAYYQRNRQKYAEYMKTYYQEVKQAVIRDYGGHCYCCGEDRLEFLTLDHLDGRGADHRRAVRTKNGTSLSSGFNTYLRVWKSPVKDPNLGVMCYNCNCAKRNGAECPHQTVLTGMLWAGTIHLGDRNMTSSGETADTQS